MRRCLFSILVAGQVASVVCGEEPRPGKQVEQKLDLGDGRFIEYLLYLPADYDPLQKYPFMLFLHGRGESDGPLSLVKKWGPPRLVDEGRQMPYIIASPQCPPRPVSWRQQGEQLKLISLLSHLEKNYSIDQGRMYLTGLSMGGYGSWRLAADHPGKFAAVAPICGKGDPRDGPKLKDLPIWAWHGSDDKAVPPSGSIDMVEAIRASGGEKIILTTLEGVGHNSWSAAYACPDLYSWFDRHSLKVVEETVPDPR